MRTVENSISWALLVALFSGLFAIMCGAVGAELLAPYINYRGSISFDHRIIIIILFALTAIGGSACLVSIIRSILLAHQRRCFLENSGVPSLWSSKSAHQAWRDNWQKQITHKLKELKIAADGRGAKDFRTMAYNNTREAAQAYGFVVQ